MSALVRETKYHNSKRAANLLGVMLASYLADFSSDVDEYERKEFALVPIPLSKERMRQRGFNQVERIAAAALASLGIHGTPSTSTLVRVRDTAAQARLPRTERLTNMKGAFAAGMIDPALSYILVDDVVTTGATLSEAAAVLRAAGASRVLCVALAH